MIVENASLPFITRPTQNFEPSAPLAPSIATLDEGRERYNGITQLPELLKEMKSLSTQFDTGEMDRQLYHPLQGLLEAKAVALATDHYEQLTTRAALMAEMELLDEQVGSGEINENMYNTFSKILKARFEVLPSAPTLSDTGGDLHGANHLAHEHSERESTIRSAQPDV